MEAWLLLREHLPPEQATDATAGPPMLAPHAWISRQDAAEKLGVGPRTIDRYIRTGDLTGYRGPLPEGGIGVRVWALDIRDWALIHQLDEV